ncbi:MAG: hypothetical protein CYPHOPRED_001467 [Cyphobasidiales sp. Tagirdzhanova-0007]|nr:MAG: hypothetical protein CYPHOPRED_001467 [Cyphobasidiales sp. Tagirdzhanova-0007]
MALLIHHIMQKSPSSSSSESTFTSSTNSSSSSPSSSSTGPCCCNHTRLGHAQPPPQLQLRTPSFSLPLTLPRPDSVQSLDYASLIFDDHLQHIPIPYILDSLHVQGPSLLRSVRDTSICIPETLSTTPLPPFLRVNLPSDPSATATATATVSTTWPDYVLAITSTDSSKTLLLPVHGLVLATHTKALKALSKTWPVPQEQVAHPDATCLPLVSLHLPSAAAFALLIPYFYTLDNAALLSSLLPLPLNHSHSHSHSLLLADTPTVLAARLSFVDQPILLNHLHNLHQLWLTAVALGAARDGLWKTMEIAWAVLVGALAVKEARNAAR